eukprot:3425479-Prymnesium_polylepis.1
MRARVPVRQSGAPCLVRQEPSRVQSSRVNTQALRHTLSTVRESVCEQGEGFALSRNENGKGAHSNTTHSVTQCGTPS